MSSSVKCVDIATEKKEMSKYDKDPQRKENGNRGGGGSVHKKKWRESEIWARSNLATAD